MALAVASTSTVSANNADNLVITAPTGIAAGDLLMIVASGFSDDAITAAGFIETIGVPVDPAGDVLERRSYLTLLYKIAVVADETAPNFTIEKAGTETLGNACMFRVTGWTIGNPVHSFASASTSSDISGGGSQGQTGLALDRPAGQLLIQAHSLNNTDTAPGFSWASPSITSSDANPVWTEIIDTGAEINASTDAGTNHLYVSFAITSDTSQITAYDASLTEVTGDNSVGYARFLASLVEPTGATVTPEFIAPSGEVHPLSIAISGIASPERIETTAAVSPLSTVSESQEWTDVPKTQNEATEYGLDIGGGFALEIGDGQLLNINNASELSDDWTDVSKS